MKKEIKGPLADACKAFAAFTKDQPYYKPTKKKKSVKASKGEG